jgi:hypothetical protein
MFGGNAGAGQEREERLNSVTGVNSVEFHPHIYPVNSNETWQWVSELVSICQKVSKWTKCKICLLPPVARVPFP